MSLIEQLKTRQQNHFLRWNGNIASSLYLVAIQGSESLSSPFRYELRSLTKMTETQLSRWHGEVVSCRIGNDSIEQPHRFLHGVVTRIHYEQHTTEEAECILTLEPSFAQLRIGRMMRVWQNISVPDLVRTLLNDHRISQLDLQLHNNYPKREYCLQYRESAFDFIQRLLEEEGIYYYFRHSESGHTLVLADHPTSHRAIEGNSLVWHHHGSILPQGSINRWTSISSLLPAGVSLLGVNMQQSTTIDDQQNASSQAPHVDAVTFIDITPQGERSLISREVKNAMAAREANTRAFDATVNAHWLCSGETFTLIGHPSGEKSYLIQTLTFEATNNFDNHNSNICCQVQAISNDQPWHPLYHHLPPEIPGILSATVVGPSSEEIHTDKYGRIKIQFPWDKKATHDDSCSCWVRVAQPWTGGKFGAQFIPRIGSEVLVSFVHGHPDYPVVIGTVYNGQNKLPFELPGNKNESGFVSRSTTKANVDEGHRLSFNDKKGEELLTIIAQRDLSLTVRNDSTATIAANRKTELTKGNDQLVLKQGDMNIALEKGNWLQKVTGDVTNELKNGNYTLKISGGGGQIQTDKTLTFESTQSIELKVGGNKISMSASGISVNGTMIKLESTSATEIKGAMIKVESSGTTELKGALTTISGSGMTLVSGGIINIG